MYCVHPPDIDDSQRPGSLSLQAGKGKQPTHLPSSDPNVADPQQPVLLHDINRQQ